METFTFRAMNTSVLLAVDGDSYSAIGLQEVRTAINSFEARFSRFQTTSELSQLNRSSGEPVRVSADLMEMLDLALRYHRSTNGLFDPSILNDLKRVGYDRSMDQLHAGSVPSSQASASQPAPKPAFTSLELDHLNRSVRLPPGMQIDLGGIAKGWIVERAARILNQYADVCAVNAGGDIFFIGEPLDGFGWEVYLEDPREAAQVLIPLHVRSDAVATSSTTKRAWKQGGETRHHLIDPRTGLPAESDWVSVTVFGASPVKAEVFAKALLIGGAGEAESLLEAHPDLAYLAVDRNGQLSGSQNYKEYVYEFEIHPR